MKVIKSNNRILLVDWQSFKPKNISSNTDIYYLNICNTLYKTFQENGSGKIFEKLSVNEIKELCCFLTSYFEDIISQTNIWQAFITKHHELYEMYVPFQNNQDYYEGEINLEDIHFLIWYFVSSKNENSLISPYNDYISNIVEDAYGVFDENFDYAPENKTLKSFYSLNTDENDYYKVRNFIEKVFLSNYLLKIDVLQRFDIQINEALQNPESENTEMLLYAVKDQFLLDTKSRLLALGANEWAAYVLGKEHSLHKDLLAISKKIFGKFLFKNKIDIKYIYIEHIASGKPFKLLKSSYERYTDIKEDSILTFGIVKWQNEWWFSGISMISPFDANEILDEKNSIESRHVVSFLEDEAVVNDFLSKQKDAFLNYNNNSLIAFLAKEQISDFTTNYYNYYNDNLNLSKKVFDKAQKRIKKEGFLSTEKDINFEDDFETAIVYFNPQSGIEIYLEICGVLDLESNPYFNKENFINDNLGLLIDDFYSTEFVNYCYNINKTKLGFLQVFSTNQLDFLIRFFKNNHYKTIPRQTPI